MPGRDSRDAPRTGTRLSLVFLILAATALPIEFRPIAKAKVDFAFDDVGDLVANIIGYVPLGIVTAGWGFPRSVLFCGLLSSFAETSQLFMMHRDPSLVDVLANVAGAALGFLIRSRFSIPLDFIRVTRFKAALAAILIVAVILYASSWKGDPVSNRGVTLPGTLEALWKQGRDATVFDGRNNVDLGHSSALRLAASMTITARIRSSSYPVDDAAIVSQRRGDLGYQLDTTLDSGPRTVGFKLTDECGEMMARYGSTLLDLDTWYHVAGVYDAKRRTLDVYVNGKLNNGRLTGIVTNAQRSSRDHVYIGHRPGSNKFNFAGSIENVHIYSFALTESQLEADMRDDPVQPPEAADPGLSQALHQICGASSDENDKELPAAAGLLGVLAAFAVIGIQPGAGRLKVLLAGLVCSLLLLAVSGPGLPSFNKWTLPLISLAGALCVIASIRQNDNGPQT